MRHATSLLRLALLAALSAFLVHPALAQQNLVPFGDFESFTAGPLPGGTGYFTQGDGTDFVVDDAVAHTGSQSLRVDYAGGATNSYDVQFVANGIAVTPGEEYTFSIWARTSTSGGTANFVVQDASFGSLGVDFYGQALTTDWQEIMATFTMPDGVEEVQIAVHFGYDANAPQSVYVDDLSLTAAVSDPPPTDNEIAFGSFEDLDLGGVTAIDGSFIQIPDGSTLTVDDAIANTGTQSLRADYGGGAANFYDFQIVAQPAATAGQEYTASVWARSETDGGTLAFAVQNPSDFSGIGEAFYGVALTTEWQEFKTTFILPDGLTSVNVSVAFGYDDTNVGNAIYVDDLSLTAVEGGGEPVEPLIVEAEGGTLGAEAATGTDGDVTYAEITTDFSAGTGDASIPQTDARVISYDVTFPAPAVYALYARIYVGPGGATDDSFLLGNGFGAKDPTLAADWVIANQLDTAGFTAGDDEVSGDGTAGGGVWKWVALTGAPRFNIADSLYTITDSDPLTQTFEIGGREDGLRFDKFAFGPVDVVYTVSELNGDLDLVDIAAARAAGVDETVRVAGTVTRTMGDFTYIQDGTAGLAIRQVDGSDFYAAVNGDTPTIVPGTTIDITGTLSEFNGLLQINEDDLASFSITGSTDVPEAQVVTLADLTTAGESYEAELVTVGGVMFTDTGDFAERTNYVVADGTAAGDVTFRVPNADDSTVDGTPIPAQSNVTGIVGQFDGDDPRDSGYQLLLIDADDILNTVDTIGGPGTEPSLRVANPIRGAATVQFATGVVGPATLAVFDVLGRQVVVLADGEVDGSEQSVRLDTAGLASGLYVVRLQAGDLMVTRTVTVVR